jgi:hypothetical protein
MNVCSFICNGLDFDQCKWRGSHEKRPLATLNSAAILFEDSVPASWEMLCFSTAEINWLMFGTGIIRLFQRID